VVAYRPFTGLFRQKEPVLIVVERPFHVSKNAFEETIKTAMDSGFAAVERPKILLSKAVILKKV
jgi:hypothetical protein